METINFNVNLEELSYPELKKLGSLFFLSKKIMKKEDLINSIKEKIDFFGKKKDFEEKRNFYYSNLSDIQKQALQSLDLSIEEKIKSLFKLGISKDVLGKLFIKKWDEIHKIILENE